MEKKRKKFIKKIKINLFLLKKEGKKNRRRIRKLEKNKGIGGKKGRGRRERERGGMKKNGRYEVRNRVLWRI